MPFESKASKSVSATGSQGAPKHQLKRCNSSAINRQLNKPLMFWRSQATFGKHGFFFFARRLFADLTSNIPASHVMYCFYSTWWY